MDGYDFLDQGREFFVKEKDDLIEKKDGVVASLKDMIKTPDITNNGKVALGAAAVGAAAAGYAGLRKFGKVGKLKVPSFLKGKDSKEEDDNQKIESLQYCERIRQILKISERELVELIECFEKADLKGYKDMINAYRDIKEYKDEIRKSSYQEIGYIPIR